MSENPTASYIIFKKLFHCIIICFLIINSTSAQTQQNTYDVVFRGKSIGKTVVQQTQTSDKLAIKVTSNTVTRMIFLIKVSSTEESVFTDERLLYSSMFREVNGKVKLNNQTKYLNNTYQTISENKTGTLNSPVINYNLSLLYCKEPVNITQVYSESLQTFLALKSLSLHKYRLETTDGSYNVYTYENGVCTDIEVHSAFYSVQMHLEG